MTLPGAYALGILTPIVVVSLGLSIAIIRDVRSRRRVEHGGVGPDGAERLHWYRYRWWLPYGPQLWVHVRRCKVVARDGSEP